MSEPQPFDQAKADRLLAVRIARGRWRRAEVGTPEKAEARQAYETLSAQETGATA